MKYLLELIFSLAFSTFSVFAIAFVLAEKHKLIELSTSVKAICFALSIIIGVGIFENIQNLKNKEL